MACRSRLLSKAICTDSSTVSLPFSRDLTFSAASRSNSVPLFQNILIALRFSTRAPISVNPALRLTVVQPLKKTGKANSHPAIRLNNIRGYLPALRLVHLFDLNDSFFLNVDGEANLVAEFQPFKKGGWINAVAHRHCFHKALNLAMLHDNLIGIRNSRDDLPFSNHCLLFNLCCLLSLLTLGRCNSDNRLWRRNIRSRIGKRFGNRTYGDSRGVRVSRVGCHQRL